MTSPEQKHHLFADIPDKLPDELVTGLAGNGHVRIERIVSWGQASPGEGWYDQDEDEWVLLVKGAARLLFEQGNRAVAMQAGDHIHIPAHCRHRVEWTDPEQESVWLAVFFSR